MKGIPKVSKKNYKLIRLFRANNSIDCINLQATYNLVFILYEKEQAQFKVSIQSCSTVFFDTHFETILICIIPPSQSDIQSENGEISFRRRPPPRASGLSTRGHWQYEKETIFDILIVFRYRGWYFGKKKKRKLATRNPLVF